MGQSTVTGFFKYTRSGQIIGNQRGNCEVCHPHCVGSITKNFCVLHIQSNTTIFHLVVQQVYSYMFRPYM